MNLPCAHEIEEQIVDYLDSLSFPEDWKAWVYQQLDPEWDEQEIQRKEVQLQERLTGRRVVPGGRYQQDPL